MHDADQVPLLFLNRKMAKRNAWAASALLLCTLFVTGATPGAADRTLLEKVDPPCVNDADCAAGQFCTSGKQNPAVSVCTAKVRFSHVIADRIGCFVLAGEWVVDRVCWCWAIQAPRKSP